MDETSAPKQPSTPEQSSTLIHERVIQPSAAMIEEMSQQAPPPPPAPVPLQAPQPPAAPAPAAPIYPVATKGLAASPAPPAPAAAAGQAGEYAPNSQKVSDRAPSLKLFAIVMLIFSALVLITVLQAYEASLAIHKIAALAHQNISPSFPFLVSAVTAALPLAASIVFLVSKNVTLVKALLIVLLINYAIGIVDVIFVMFSKHISLSPGFIVGLVIDLGFALWTWSVFSEVNILAA